MLCIATCEQPEEIADFMLFLASKKAGYITGTTINMDGTQYPVIK
jgi:NAD(P)-dependent dehydrogenase (short-subunit alcohol dehydrogenase family)